MRPNSLLPAVALAMTLVIPALGENPEVQKKTTTTTQEIFSSTSTPSSSNTSGTSGASATPGANAGVQTPVGNAQTAVTPAGVANPMTERTYTQEEVTMAQNNPPIRWSVLEGEVTHVDKSNNVVEIKLKGSDNHIGIPVVQNKVGIYKHGDHQYALKDIQPGDDVTLRNLNTASM